MPVSGLFPLTYLNGNYFFYILYGILDVGLGVIKSTSDKKVTFNVS